MTTLKLLTAAALIILWGSVARAQHADITWSSAVNIAADTDVSTTGSLVAAYNIGDTGVAATTINGVTFGAFPIADGSSGASAGGLSVTGFSSQAVTTSLNLGTGSAPYVGLSANYKAMLGKGVVKSTSIQILDLNLSGLISGNSYLVQLWINDSAPAAGSPSAPREVSDYFGHFGPVDANVSDAPGGLGKSIIGSFVADAATEFLSVHGDFSQVSTGGAVLNGLQLRTTSPIPEPATLGLLTCACVLWSHRRTR